MRFAHGSLNSALSSEGHDLAVDWPPAKSNTVRLSAGFRKNKRDNVVDSASGTWALFRLIAKSSYAAADANGTATWSNHGIKDGVPVRLEIKHVNGVPLLQPGWMGNALRCVSTVAR